ncbi:MAG TPA: AAA family ATPase [Devosiaceae bacterium]|jgi:predicted kinase|nr:AAA family ATPase [Devosiaceae bacterium]
MLEAAGQVAILTGPPGAGKTTTARTLVPLVGGPGVHLHSDDFWRYIRSGAILPWLPAARDQNAVVIDVIAGAAGTYARGGYFVVLDGIIGPWFLMPFRRLGVPLHYIVLRPPLGEAIDRCRRRGGDELDDPDPIAALHRQFSDLGELESHVIDTAGESAEGTLAAVEAAFRSGRFRLR